MFPEGVESFHSKTTPESALLERLTQLCNVLREVNPPPELLQSGSSSGTTNSSTSSSGGEAGVEFIRQVASTYKPLAAFLATPRTFDEHSNRTIVLLTAVALGELFRIVPTKLYANGPLNADQYSTFVTNILASAVMPTIATETDAESQNFQLAAQAISLVSESKALCAISSPTGLMSKPHQKSTQQQMMQKIYYSIIKIVYLENLHDPGDRIKLNLVSLTVDTLFGGKNANFPPESIVLAILQEYVFNAAKGPDNPVSRFMEHVLTADIDRIEPVICQVICSELNKHADKAYVPREKLLWSATLALFIISPLFVRNILTTLDSVMRCGSEERRMLYVVSLGTMWANDQFYMGNLVRQIDRQFIQTNFLARACDMSPKVRQHVVSCLPAILCQHYAVENAVDGGNGGVVDKVRDAFQHRLVDPDDSVRETVLTTLTNLARHTSEADRSLEPLFLLFDARFTHEVCERIRDVSAKVRQAALDAAVGAYVQFLRAVRAPAVRMTKSIEAADDENFSHSDDDDGGEADDAENDNHQRSSVNSSSSTDDDSSLSSTRLSPLPLIARQDFADRFGTFPEYLLETHATFQIGGDKIQIERFLYVALFSIDEVDADERARRLVSLYCSLVDTPFQVFHLIMAYHFRTHEYMKLLLQEIRACRQRAALPQQQQSPPIQPPSQLEQLQQPSADPLLPKQQQQQSPEVDLMSTEFQRIRLRLEQMHLSDTQRNMNDGYQQIIELLVSNADVYRHVTQLVLYKFGKEAATQEGGGSDNNNVNQDSNNTKKLLRKEDPRPLLRKFRELCARADGTNPKSHHRHNMQESMKSVLLLAGERISERIVPFKLSASVLSLAVQHAAALVCKPELLGTLFIPCSGYPNGRLTSEDVQKRALQLIGDVLILYPRALLQYDSLNSLLQLIEKDDQAELASAAIKVLIKWCKTVQDDETRAMVTEIKPRLENLVRQLARGSSSLSSLSPVRGANKIRSRVSDNSSLILGTTSYSPYVAKEAIRFLMEICDQPLLECRVLLDHLQPMLQDVNDVRCVSAMAVIGDMADLLERIDVRAQCGGDDADDDVYRDALNMQSVLRGDLRRLFLDSVEPNLIQAELQRSSLPYRRLMARLTQQNVAAAAEDDAAAADWQPDLNIESLLEDDINKKTDDDDDDIDNASTPRDVQQQQNQQPAAQALADDVESTVMDLSDIELDQVANEMRQSQQMSSQQRVLVGISPQKRSVPNTAAGGARQTHSNNMESIPELADADDDDVDGAKLSTPAAAAEAASAVEVNTQTGSGGIMNAVSNLAIASQQINTNMSVLRSLGAHAEFFRPKTILPVRVQTKLYAMRALGKWASTLTRKRDSVLLEDCVLKLYYNIVRSHAAPNSTTLWATAASEESSAVDAVQYEGMSKKALRELDRCYTLYTASVVLLRLYRRFNPSFGIEQFHSLSSLMKHPACPFGELRRKYCQKLKRLSQKNMPVWVLLIYAHTVALEQDANDDALREYVADLMDAATQQFRQLVMESPGKQARYLPELCLFYAVYFLAHSSELPTPHVTAATTTTNVTGGAPAVAMATEWTGQEPALTSAVRILNFIIEIISRTHPQFTLNALTVVVQRIKASHVVVDSSLLMHAAVTDVNDDDEADDAGDTAIGRSLTRKAWALADLCNDLLTARFVHRMPGPLLNIDIVEPKGLFTFRPNLNANSMKRSLKSIQVFLRLRARPYVDVVQIGKPSTLATQSSTQFESQAQALHDDAGEQQGDDAADNIPAGGGAGGNKERISGTAVAARIMTRRRIINGGELATTPPTGGRAAVNGDGAGARDRAAVVAARRRAFTTPKRKMRATTTTKRTTAPMSPEQQRHDDDETSDDNDGEAEDEDEDENDIASIVASEISIEQQPRRKKRRTPPGKKQQKKQKAALTPKDNTILRYLKPPPPPTVAAVAKRHVPRRDADDADDADIGIVDIDDVNEPAANRRSDRVLRSRSKPNSTAAPPPRVTHRDENGDDDDEQPHSSRKSSTTMESEI